MDIGGINLLALSMTVQLRIHDKEVSWASKKFRQNHKNQLDYYGHAIQLSENKLLAAINFRGNFYMCYYYYEPSFFI